MKTPSLICRVARPARKVVSQLAGRAEQLILPGLCVVCYGSGGQSDICRSCVRNLPWNCNACIGCALPGTADQNFCDHCLRSPPPWRCAFSVFVYDFPVAALLHQFKFSRRLATGRVLSELLAARLHRVDIKLPDYLVPVPLHWRRRLQRQFNQADEIAAVLSDRLDIPVLRAVRRARPTPAQSGLVASARRHNLSDAFSLVGTVTGRRLALIDDVLTTGSTAASIATVLLKGGAVSVDVWTLARALPHRNPANRHS